jgi:hypothetical protein
VAQLAVHNLPSMSDSNSLSSPLSTAPSVNIPFAPPLFPDQPSPTSGSSSASTFSSNEPSSPLSAVPSFHSLYQTPLLLNQPLHADSSSSPDSSPIATSHKPTMLSQLKFVSIEHDAPSKVLMLLPGDITPTVMHMYENAYNSYFDTKDIAEDKQVHKICLLTITFTDFLAKFKTAHLPKDWEEITCIELLQVMQGTDSFWDFLVQVQAKNSILAGTQSHFTEMHLHHHIESSVNPKLALHACLKKVVSDSTLTQWPEEVKHSWPLTGTRSPFQ